MLAHVFAHHNPWLVTLAAAICAGGSLTTFTIYSHLLARGSGRRTAWLFLTGFCTGAGIWATHFVAMLAHDSGLPTSYNVFLTALSFVIAASVTTLGVATSLRPGRREIATGGAIIGLGIAAMHFTGMLALITPATFQWNETLIALSVLMGVVFTAAAMLVYRAQSGFRALFSGAALFTLGICSLHFTAMAALTIVASPKAHGPVSNIAEQMLAIVVAGITAVILGAGLVVAVMDRRVMRDSLARTGELVEAAIEGLVIADRGAIVNINARALELCGRKGKELIGKRVFGDLLAPMRRPTGASASRLFEASLLRADRTTIPVEVVQRALHGLSHGNEVYAIRDLREREEAARQLAQANEELRRSERDLRSRNLILDAALANMSQGLCMYDLNQQVVTCNERFATIYGLPGDAIKPGMSLQDVVQMRIDNGLYAGRSPAAYLEERLAPVLRPEESIHELNNGQIIAIARRPMPGGGWVTTHTDITDQRRIEAQISHLAHHDALTGLLSRTSFRDRLKDDLRSAQKRDRRLAVFVLGIDRFNEINDTLGHAVGDSLLKSIAQRLQDCPRRSTLLGRFGDDTFALVEVVERPGKDATAVANRIQKEIRKPFNLGGTSLEVTATVGIALSPADGTDTDTLLKNAALALNRGKIETRGCHHFFEPIMDRQLRARRALEQELAEAMAKGEFIVQYQPLINVVRNDIAGFEARLFWQHPSRGLEPAESFVPLAEETGHMTAIREWMLRHACAEAVHWPKHLSLAVALSVAEFRAADFVRSVSAALTSTGLRPDRLEIEVSEKAMRDAPEQAIGILRQLAGLGIRITLNDFGSGFASLNYLRLFPLHKIKIDHSFLRDLSARPDSRVIIRTLARLGTGLGMVTAVDGIESKEQIDILRADGCTEMQSHAFSPPKTSEEVRKLFQISSGGRAEAVA